MSWVKLDDCMPDHPKFDTMSDKAFRLWVESLCYCSRQSTSVITKTRLGLLTRGRRPEIYAQELVRAGLWTDHGGCFEVNACLCIFQKEGESPLRNEWRRVRKDLAPLVLMRDDHQCKHCGCGESLSVDHIVPLSRGGSNDLDNLQTLCVPCNSRKGNRMESLN